MKKLYGVGTGPGNPDLLTLRSVNIIREVDIIFTPNNKGKNMALDTAREFIQDKEVVYLDFPMGEVVKKDYEKAAKIILDRIPEAGKGAFLTIGDPMIYSTFIYLMEELEDQEIHIEISPGIPSFLAGAGEAKVALTTKGDSFILCDEFQEDLLDYGDSLAILKTLRNKEELINTLEENKYDYDYLKKISLEDQRILKNKEEILRDKNYMSLILARKEGKK